MPYDPFGYNLGTNPGAAGSAGYGYGAPSSNAGLTGLTPAAPVTDPSQLSGWGALPDYNQFGFSTKGGTASTPFGPLTIPSFSPNADFLKQTYAQLGIPMPTNTYQGPAAPTYTLGAPGSGGPPPVVPPHGYGPSVAQPAPPPKPAIPAPTGPDPRLVARQWSMARRGMGPYPPGWGPQGRLRPPPAPNFFTGQMPVPGYQAPARSRPT